MGIFWKDLYALVKPRLSQDDLVRICIEFAHAGLEQEQVTTAFSRLSEMDATQNWFHLWQRQIDPSLKRISSHSSKRNQSTQCRVEILNNLDKVALNNFILNTEDDNVRELLLASKYSEEGELSYPQHWGLFVQHYSFGLLNQVAYEGLYLQQFNRFLSKNEFLVPYNAVTVTYVNVLCYTILFDNLAEYGSEETRDLSAMYTDIVSSKILGKLREAKEEFSGWIAEGHVDGIEHYKSRFIKLADEYSSVIEAAQNVISIQVASP